MSGNGRTCKNFDCDVPERLTQLERRVDKVVIDDTSTSAAVYELRSWLGEHLVQISSEVAHLSKVVAALADEVKAK